MKSPKTNSLLVAILILQPSCGGGSGGPPATGGPPPAWAKTYRGSVQDTAISIHPTADGGFILGGNTTSWGAGSDEAWVLKLAADGAVEWEKAFGGSASDTLRSVAQTLDGGYILAGSTNSFGAGNTDAWVLKVDSTGGILWEFAFGGGAYDCGYDARQTSDGGYIVCGATESFGAGQRDAWVLKLTSTGGITWQKTVGAAGSDQLFQVKERAGGGFALGGQHSTGPGNAPQAWLVCLDSDGSITLQKRFGGITAGYTEAVHPTSDGGFLLAGEMDIGVGVTATGVYKIDSLGALVWARAFYQLGYPTFGRSVLESSSGQYLFLGTAFVVGQHFQCWLVNLNANGSTAWQKGYGAAGGDLANCLSEAPDGGFVMAAYTSPVGGGDNDLWVLKTLPDGDLPPLSSALNLTVNTLPASTVNTSTATAANSAATVTVTAATVTNTAATVTQQVP